MSLPLLPSLTHSRAFCVCFSCFRAVKLRVGTLSAGRSSRGLLRSLNATPPPLPMRCEFALAPPALALDRCPGHAGMSAISTWASDAKVPEIAAALLQNKKTAAPPQAPRRVPARPANQLQQLQQAPKKGKKLGAAQRRCRRRQVMQATTLPPNVCGRPGLRQRNPRRLDQPWQSLRRRQ